MHPPKVRYLVQHDLTLPEGPASNPQELGSLDPEADIRLCSTPRTEDHENGPYHRNKNDMYFTISLYYSQRELSYNVFSYKPNSLIDSSSI